MALAQRKIEPRNVLVVDDEQSILHAIEDILEDDYHVVTSTSGQEALKLLAEMPFAVILSDQRMPEITGDRFLTEARKLSEATRIMITGYADMDAICKAVNDGQIYAYVAKPWDPRNLRVVVSRAADRFTLAEELHKERQLLHALMENTPDSVYFKDDALRYIAANKACARMLNIDLESELVGRRTEEVAAPHLAARLAELEEQVLAEGRSVIDHLIKSDGGVSERWYSVTQVPLRTQDNATSGVVSVARDVTDRMHAEMQLRESRERFRAVLDGTPALIYLKDVQGRFVIVNKRYAETFGLDVTEIEGKTAHDLLPAAVADEINAYEQEILSAEEPISREIRMHDVDGQLRTYFIRAVPILNSDGEVNGICGIQADMTEQHKLAEQLRQAQKMESIGQLTGGIAHDFNNLLTIIMGNLELLNRKLEPGTGLQKRVETAKNAVLRGQSLTRQLLVFARKQDLAPEVVSVTELFQEVGVLLKRTLGQTIECTTLSTSNYKVNVDPGQLESAILNLCINARDAMPNGGKIIVEAEDVHLNGRNGSQSLGVGAGHYVVIAVTDSGVGIPKEIREHIFEPFFTTKEKGKGTGLGLSMVHGFVHQSGGGIHVYSEVGIGTTFKIYLPAVVGELQTPSEVASAARPVAAGKGNEIILLVEDDDDVRETAVAILEDLGYRIIAVPHAAAAMKVACEDRTIDLLFTDVLMPGGMNGAQLAEKIREIRPRLPIVFTSGYTANAIESIEALPSGSEFLSKPYLEEQLAAKIRAALDSAGS